jgi:hypothetical protein
VSDVDFPDLIRRVCHEQGWNLLPSGVEVRFEDGRHQLVELEFVQHDDGDVVRLFTTIGLVSSLTPVRLTIALRINAELALGAFAVKDEHLVMVDTLLLPSADEAQVTASVRFLAETADYYEKAIFETDDY